MSNVGRDQAIAPLLPPVEGFDEEDDESTGNVIDVVMDAKLMADVEQEAEV
jgi:hypothetical protein